MITRGLCSLKIAVGVAAQVHIADTKSVAEPEPIAGITTTTTEIAENRNT